MCVDERRLTLCLFAETVTVELHNSRTLKSPKYPRCCSGGEYSYLLQVSGVRGNVTAQNVTKRPTKIGISSHARRVGNTSVRLFLGDFHVIRQFMVRSHCRSETSLRLEKVSFASSSTTLTFLLAASCRSVLVVDSLVHKRTRGPRSLKSIALGALERVSSFPPTYHEICRVRFVKLLMLP